MSSTSPSSATASYRTSWRLAWLCELCLDLVDAWMKRSIDGCQYHVAHPGGRNYVTFPVNAYEAQALRLARFLRIGHMPGTMRLPPEERNPDFPFTLDMRRQILDD